MRCGDQTTLQMVLLQDVVDIQKHPDTIFGFGHGQNVTDADPGP